MFTTLIHLLTRLTVPGRRAGGDRDERGQATAEYALVLLGAAAIALLVVSWATKTDLVGRLLDVVFGELTSKAK